MAGPESERNTIIFGTDVMHETELRGLRVHPVQGVRGFDGCGNRVEGLAGRVWLGGFGWEGLAGRVWLGGFG